MNKLEVAEIKSTIKKDDNSIKRICICYVDSKGNKRFTLNEPFYSIDNEEMFKYIDILKKVFSGTLEKNLLNMSFPENVENEDSSPWGMLMKMKDSLDDEEMLDKFYDRIIDSYKWDTNYLIMLINQDYDVFNQTSDNVIDQEFSDTVFSYVLCAICPLKLTKPGLLLDPINNKIKNMVRDLKIDPPLHGFLFPAFNDRMSDIHNMLFYTKKPGSLDMEFADEMFNSKLSLSAGEQKENFSTIVENSLGRDCSYEAAKIIHENLIEMIDDNKENPEPITLDKEDVKKLLTKSGMTVEEAEYFDECFSESVGEKSKLALNNITNTRNFELKTEDIKIQVNPRRTDLIETKMIDGVMYLMIECNENVTVNGIKVRAGEQKQDF